MSETLPALDASNAHPVHLVVTDYLRRGRVTIFFRPTHASFSGD